MLEDAGPELHQYLVENNTEGRPFNRDTRSLIYQRAKSVADKKPFGIRARHVRRGLHVDDALGGAPPDAGGPRRHAARSRSEVRQCEQPYSLLGAEHLGDELRRARSCGSASDEHRSQAGPFRPRHGRGRALEVPPRERWRPDLADRYWLLRLPNAGRRLRPGAVPEERRPRPGEDDRDQGVAGRQARPRRHPARRQGHRGDRRGTARSAGQGRVLTHLPQGVLDPASR